MNRAANQLHHYIKAYNLIILASSSRAWALSLRRRRDGCRVTREVCAAAHAATHANCLLSRLLELVSRSGLLAWRAVPVVDHLRSQNGIEHEARYEAVKDEFVVYFLQSREDARQ